MHMRLRCRVRYGVDCARVFSWESSRAIPTEYHGKRVGERVPTGLISFHDWLDSAASLPTINYLRLLQLGAQRAVVAQSGRAPGC